MSTAIEHTKITCLLMKSVGSGVRYSQRPRVRVTGRLSVGSSPSTGFGSDGATSHLMASEN